MTHYRRRNAASSADVLVLHMLSAILIVYPGGDDLVDAIEQVAGQIDVAASRSRREIESVVKRRVYPLHCTG